MNKKQIRKEAMDNNFLKDFQSEDIQTLLKDTIQSNYSGVTLEDRWQDLDELDRMELLLQLYYNYGIDVPLDMDETLSVTSPQLEEILLKASKEDDSVELIEANVNGCPRKEYNICLDGKSIARAVVDGPFEKSNEGFKKGEIALQGFYVSPKHRGKGLASKLMDKVKSDNSGSILILSPEPFEQLEKDESLPEEIKNNIGTLISERKEKAVPVKPLDDNEISQVADLYSDSDSDLVSPLDKKSLIDMYKYFGFQPCKDRPDLMFLDLRP